MLDRKLLSIYLNDHLAGSTGGVELARRAASSNRGTSYGEFLEWLARAVAEDREALIELMERFAIRRDPLKQAAAWSLEKAGRLKLNGRLTGYSPLSRLVELEGLWIGVEGKLSLWQVLLALPEDADPRLDRERLAVLEGRAQEQLRRLDEHRPAVAVETLAA